jgi:ubiquitin carboxyl-terminal hydrolase 34
MEFDDSKVFPFNMKNFEEECFGVKAKSDYPYNMYGTDTPISKSAYILVYEKVKKRDIKIHFNEKMKTEMDMIINNMKNSTEYKINDSILETDFYNFKPFIPENLKEIIDKDNVSLILEK